MARGDGINFRIGGDASGALSENEKLRRSQDETNNEFAKAAKVSSAAANRIIRDIETQQQRFKRLRSEIYRGWDQNKLSTEQYGKAIRKLEQDYKQNEGQFKKFAGSTTDGMDEMEDSANRFGDAIAGWGPRLLAAVSFMSTIRQGYQEIESSIRKSGEGVLESRASIGQLRQLADSQAEFDQLKGAANRLYLSGATETKGEAAGAVFSLSSAGLLNEEAEALFLQLGARGVVPDLGTFARAIRTQLAAFGRDETGDAVQIASKAFAASAYSPASVEELLEAASLPGGTARALGISDEETLAATALLATSTGSASVGATALRSFLSSTAQVEEFEGKSITERVRLLKSKNLSVADLLKSPSQGGLGRKEAVRAYTDLENQLPLLQQVLGSVNRANFDRSAIDRKTRFVDPLGEAARLKRSADAQASLETESLAARRLITDGVYQRGVAEFSNTMPSPVAATGVGLSNMVLGLGAAMYGQTGREGFFSDSMNRPEADAIEALKRMPDLIEKQTAAMEKLLGEQLSEQKQTKDELKKKEGLSVTNE
ncbi:Phage-related minor tail protein [Posidoniimonas corsicana]|uniref:Phage-related minor tail protein n=1 Tax=Posidoniimonas corsicana TaxID=1938618 RepID=A0A5C5VCH4_9BACT|nr:phage tail tape measure protein [Posidoniimonas corsicana]TWT35315.1 Phage-related minor tail protein [Posidoniimonas corsicana]